MQNKNKKTLIMGLILAYAGSVGATEIAVDLGPRNNNLTTELFAPFSSTAFVFDGRTLSIDLTFNGEFIHLFKETFEGFAIGTYLQISGTGTEILDPIGSGYTVGADGQQNGLTWIQDSGGLSGGDGSFINATLPLGFMLPLNFGQAPADIYGLHFDLTMPANGDFTSAGGFIRFATDAWGRPAWSNTFAVGPHVPENGGTGWMLLSALGLVQLFRIKQKKA